MANRLDIVLFGASGFTGKYCIEEIHKLAKSNNPTLTWGIAGRSEAKLKNILVEYGKKNDEDLSSIPTIIADSTDYDSLVAMTARAKVIINCSGPYRFVGEPVIKACLETGTHQVDVTGETQYIETIQLKYHKAAEEKGVYIVSACGFDSIPADLGVVYLQNKFQGTLNSVETYLQLSEEPPTPGPSANYTTWQCLVLIMAHASELITIRRQLYPNSLPNFLPKLKPRLLVHKSEIIDTWCVPFLGCDRSVVRRSQHYLHDLKKIRPVQVQTYMGISFIELLVLMLIVPIFTILIRFEFGRNLLLKHPKIFSAGIFSHEGPSEKKIKSSKFSLTIHGRGWSDLDSEIEVACTKTPNKTAEVRVSGTNPFYGITCTGVTLSALVILTEANKLPDRGGVYTPGAAFADTSLINKLQENGWKFEIIHGQ